MTFITIILLAYLLGGIPWGYLIARFYGVDIQKIGSGSTGATNIYRALGLPVAMLVGALDILKGTFITAVAVLSLNSHYQIALVVLTVILGHTFSPFLKGRGGKGIATGFGAFLILAGWKVMLIIFFIWICAVLVTRIMSLTNLIFVFFLPIYFAFINPEPAYFLLSVAITILIYWVHRPNIERLQQGKEPRLQVSIGFRSDKPKTVETPKIVAKSSLSKSKVKPKTKEKARPKTKKKTSKKRS